MAAEQGLALLEQSGLRILGRHPGTMGSDGRSTGLWVAFTEHTVHTCCSVFIT